MANDQAVRRTLAELATMTFAEVAALVSDLRDQVEFLEGENEALEDAARPGEGGPALTLDERNSGGSDE